MHVFGQYELPSCVCMYLSVCLPTCLNRGLGLGSDTNTSYSVIDYAWRSAVELEDMPDQAPSPAPASAANGSQYAAIQPAVSPQQSRQGSYEIASVTAAVGAQNALKLVLIENAYQKNAVFLMVTSCQ